MTFNGSVLWEMKSCLYLFAGEFVVGVESVDGFVHSQQSHFGFLSM